MPLIDQRKGTSANSVTAAATAQHGNHISSVGHASLDWFAMVHTPVKNWMNVPGARKSVDKELDKLDNPKNPAWL